MLASLPPSPSTFSTNIRQVWGLHYTEISGVISKIIALFLHTKMRFFFMSHVIIIRLLFRWIHSILNITVIILSPNSFHS